jgi:molybdopterin-guanine dinucleotide biosynthesis protein MobB
MMRLKYEKAPVIIGIGGSYSSIGKTTVASAILKALKDKEKWGAIKYTKTAFFTSIIYDKSILDQKNKDTQRFLEAGAKDVLWVQSPENELNEVLPIAVHKLSYLDGIIVEGNSAIEFLKPDIVIFIKGLNKKMKPSAKRVLSLADIVLEKDSLKSLLKNINDFMRLIMDKVEKKRIEEALKKFSFEKEITCSDARKIAEELGVSYIEIGKMANDLKIKIKNCELGCF